MTIFGQKKTEKDGTAPYGFSWISGSHAVRARSRSRAVCEVGTRIGICDLFVFRLRLLQALLSKKGVKFAMMRCGDVWDVAHLPGGYE